MLVAIFRPWGFRGNEIRDMVGDLDRLFHVLDGKTPPSHLADAGNLVNSTSHAHGKGCESEIFPL